MKRAKGTGLSRVLFTIIILLASLYLTTCGIDEYYYLPQVPEQNVRTSMNITELVIPPIDQFYYASNYTIYYRIYISDQRVDDYIETRMDVLNGINTSLWGDFNSLSSSTNPTTTTNNAMSYFKDRYFRLEIEGGNIYNAFLSTRGGTITIEFPANPGEHPYVEFNKQKIRLLRSSDLLYPRPPKPLYFLNSVDLSNNENAIDSINADVKGGSTAMSGTERYTYVSMYIIAEGLNPGLFSPIYSKPTHISVFKLP